MTAARKNLTIEQGATFFKNFTLRDKNKRPINLTGYGARMHVRSTTDVLIVELSTENEKIALGGARGTVNLLLSDEETAVMDFPHALYDLILNVPGGDVIRLLQGKVTLSLGQTKQ